MHASPSQRCVLIFCGRILLRRRSPFSLSSSRRSFLQQASALGLLYSAQRALPQTDVAMHMAGMQDQPHIPSAHPASLRTSALDAPHPRSFRPSSTPSRSPRSPGHSPERPPLPHHHHAGDPRQGPPRRPSYPHVELRPQRARPADRSPLQASRSRSPGSTISPPSTSSPSTTPSTAAATTSPTSAPSPISTAPRLASKDDGYPEDWFVPGQSRTCTYPLQQDATALWYHDHAMGLNRLNTYAGLFGMFLLRDHVEDALHLPSGKYEIPLIFYDRNFAADGQLFYDDSGDPEHPWIPEFSADGILINGKIRPFFEVEPRLYRFRLLNTANSRFFLSRSLERSAAHPDRHRPGPPLRARRPQAPRPRPRRTRRHPHRLHPLRRPDPPPPHRSPRHPRVPRRKQSSLTVTSTSIPKTLRPIERIPSPPPPPPAPSRSTSIKDRVGTPWSCSSTASAGTSPSPKPQNSTPPRSGSSSTSPKTPTPCTSTWCASRSSTAAPSMTSSTWRTKTSLHRPAVPPDAQRTRLEGHRPVPPRHDHPHHRPLRRLHRQIPLPLPHPRARSQRHDAPLRSHRLTVGV